MVPQGSPDLNKNQTHGSQNQTLDPSRVLHAENYMRQNMSYYPLENLKNALIAGGYSDEEVNQAVANLNNYQPSTQPVQQYDVDPLDFGNLLKSSWYFFKNNALVLTFIPIISYIPWFLFGFILVILHSDTIPYIEALGSATATSDEQIESMKYLFTTFITSPVLILTVLIGMIVSFIGTLAIYRAIVDIDKGQKVGVLTAYKDALPFILPFYLVSILQGLAVMSGLFLFIIPGIIFAFWFMFSQFSLLSDGYKGVDALKHSKEIVSGKVWAIVWRNIVLGLILFVIGIPVAIFALIPFLGDIAQLVFEALGTVYVTIFSYHIFKAVKQVKGMK